MFNRLWLQCSVCWLPWKRERLSKFFYHIWKSMHADPMHTTLLVLWLGCDLNWTYMCMWIRFICIFYINNRAKKIPKTEKEEATNRRDNSSTLMEYALLNREILCDVRFLLLFSLWFLICCSGDADDDDVVAMFHSCSWLCLGFSMCNFLFYCCFFFLFRASYFISFL